MRGLGLFSLEKERLGVCVCLTNVYVYMYSLHLKGGCKEDSARPFSGVPNARTRGKELDRVTSWCPFQPPSFCDSVILLSVQLSTCYTINNP